MKGAWRKVGLMLVLVTAVTLSAQAGDLSWVFQYTGIVDTGNEEGGDDCIALAMRGGNAWPVVFTSGESAMLLPTGWYNLGYNKTGERPVAASSPMGRIAVAGDGNLGSVASPNGWASLYAAAVAFDQQGRLWTATDEGDIRVDGSYLGNINPGITYNSIDIDVNANGTVGVVASDSGNNLEYYNYSPLTNTWEGGPVEIDFEFFGVDDAPVSLAFDGLGRPNITYQKDSGLFVAGFDIPSGTWGKTYLADLSNGTSSLNYRVPIECSNDGTLGLAYVSDGQLFYKYKTGDGMWTIDRIDDQFDGNIDTGEVGLAYDYDGIPVVAFVGNGNGVYLAYDPIIVTPEPATMSLLSLGGLVMLRRRKK